jgi:serine/threonine protein kinase
VTAADTLIAGRYRLVRQLAAGGMGTVWLAQDERLARPVAVKLLHPQPGLSRAEAELVKQRALREARLTARLHHPNAVPVYDVVEHTGLPCLVMQYLPSRSLQTILTEHTMLPPSEVARIGAQLASALAAAHQAGIVHRDVKPANVLLGEDGTAKLTDFGVSHALGDASLTTTGMVTGTPAYLAPEVARGVPSSFASDVHSLGATLYAALEGAPPYGSGQNPMATLHRVASGQPNPPTHGGPLTPLLLRMLAADPAERPTMPEVAHTLQALQTDIASTTAPLLPSGPAVEPTAVLPAYPGRISTVRTSRSQPVWRWIAPALAVLVVVIALATAVALLSRHQGTHSPGIAQGSRSSTSAPATRSSTSAPATRSSTSAPATRSSQSSSSASKVAADPTAAALAKAIVDYYALLPEHTDRDWDLLTQRYRHDHALTKHDYQNFWDGVSAVSVSNSTGTAPSTAQATITYTFKDGRVVQELTRYGLVNDHGTWKIDSSTVLNSTPASSSGGDNGG